MVLRFGKLHCLGDDLMLVELLGQHAHLGPALIERWASRTAGVGFRRLVLVEIPRMPDADFACRVFDRQGRELDAGVADLCAALHWIGAQQLSNQAALVLQCRQGLRQVRLCQGGWMQVSCPVALSSRSGVQQLPAPLQLLLQETAPTALLAGSGQQLLIWSESAPAQRLQRLLQPMARRLRGWQLFWMHAHEDAVRVENWQAGQDQGLDPVLLVAQWLAGHLQRPAVRVEWQQVNLLLEFDSAAGELLACASVELLFEGQIQA